MFVGEVKLYKDFLEALANHIRMVTSSFVPTGWEQIDKNIETAQYNLTTAEIDVDFQAVGLTCRETLKALAHNVFDTDRHPITDTAKVGKDDTERKFEAYIAHELAGSHNEEVRSYAKKALKLANTVTHRRPANFRDTAICLEATTSIVNIIAIISDQRK